MDLCLKVQEILIDEPNIIEYSGDPIVCGDLHGRYDDLLVLFQKFGFPPQRDYIFLGDLVDRGNNSLFVVLLLFAYKILYPSHIVIIRGNHESSSINAKYGFQEECLHYFNGSSKCYAMFNKTFTYFPLGCIINQSILCVHGGISEKIKTLQDISSIDRFFDNLSNPVFQDLLWSDPIPDFPYDQNDSSYYYEFNDPRKCAAFFSGQCVAQFCQRNHLAFIIRGHEKVTDGYRVDFNGRLYTLDPYKDKKRKNFFILDLNGNKPTIVKVIEEIYETQN